VKKSLDALGNCSLRTESKEAATALNEQLQQMADALYLKSALIRSCQGGFNFQNFVKQKLKVVYPDFKINVYASAKNTKVSADVRHPALYKKLLLLRDKICNEEHKPIYMVANTKTLTELCNYLPATPEQLLKISGFGKAKVETFGDDFLKVIRDYMDEHDLASEIDLMEVKKDKKPKKEKLLKAENEEPVKLKPDTREQSYSLYRQGISLEEIARQRGITLNTVQGHLLPYIAAGELDLEGLLSPQKQDLIAKALEGFEKSTGLNAVKQKLPADISFAEIKYVMAAQEREKNA
jgi:ribonuclease D